MTTAVEAAAAVAEIETEIPTARTAHIALGPHDVRKYKFGAERQGEEGEKGREARAGAIVAQTVILMMTNLIMSMTTTMAMMMAMIMMMMIVIITVIKTLTTKMKLKGQGCWRNRKCSPQISPVFSRPPPWRYKLNLRPTFLRSSILDLILVVRWN